MRLAVTKAILAVLVGVGIAVAGTPSPVPADLVPVLDRAARYVLDYEQAFHDIAAEETYTQRTGPQPKTTATGLRLLCTPWSCQRTTRADIVFVRLGGEVPWATFRDVFEVDGQNVRDREQRLEALFGASSPARGAERAQAILTESARYNIGPALRNINFPTLALVFLHPRNQHRFAWKRGGARRFTTVQALEVEFEETARPTLVNEGGRGDLPAKGRLWIDPARGTVLRSETVLQSDSEQARARVTTEYRAEPKLAMWVPAEMREIYEDLPGAPVFHHPIQAVARYSNFRRFTVTIEDVTARLPGETTQQPPAKPAEVGQPAPEPPTETVEPAAERQAAPPTESPSALPHAEATSGAQATQAPPTFPSAVELITVDAVVLDEHGQPVPGLTKDDFVVSEDGRPRGVVSFEAFDVSARREEPETVALAAVASNEVPASDSGRGFAILVDDVNMAPERTPAVHETVKAFLERSVRDGDLVALGTASGNVWWSARVPEGREDLLAVVARARGRLVDVSGLEPMSDYEAFWIANREDSGNTFGEYTARVVTRWQATGACPVVPGGESIGCEAMVRARAIELEHTRKTRMGATLAGVRRAIEAMAPVRGRKSLLLLSDGFLDDLEADTRAVTALSREANTAVYFLDVHGLEALPGGLGSAAYAGPPPSGRERFEAAYLWLGGAVALAEDTGGFAVRNRNDLAAGAARVAAESRVFYLLGFHPAEGKAPGEWRKLRVEVKRPGLAVRARRGYTIGSEWSSAAAKPSPERKGKEKKKEPALDTIVARAIDSPHAGPGIALRAIAYVLEPRPKDRVHVLVAAELDAGTFGPVAPEERSLEVTTVALLRDTGRALLHADTVTVSAPKDHEGRWRALAREFELPPGVAQMKVVVRDPATGAIGSVVQRIEVPSPDEFRVSTPILTDRFEPASSPGQPPRLTLAAHRVFAGAGLYCRYEVFGATRPGGAPPRVSSGFQLRSEDGAVVKEAPATPIAPDRDDHLVRMVSTSLEKLAAGAYEFVLDVRDEATGRSVVRREAFVLAPGGR